MPILSTFYVHIECWKYRLVQRMLRVHLLLLLLCQDFPPNYQLVGTPNASLSHSPQTVGPHAACHLLTTTSQLPEILSARKKFLPENFPPKNLFSPRNSVSQYFFFFVFFSNTFLEIYILMVKKIFSVAYMFSVFILCTTN